MNKSLPLIFSGGMMLISGFLLLHSFIAPPHTAASLDTDFGILFYPRIVLTIWLGCATSLFFQYLYKKRLFTLKSLSWKLLGTSMALTLMVCIVFEYLGFIPGCIAFCFLYPFLLGYRNLKVLVPVAVLYAIALWFTFNKVLLIVLPESPWM